MKQLTTLLIAGSMALATLSWRVASAEESGTAATAAIAKPARVIVLPPEIAALKPSPLAGYAVARLKCALCHSADYISYQPPSMTLAQWTAEMVKMQHSYGAPIDDDEVKLLGIYLAATYGNASTVRKEDLALK